MAKDLTHSPIWVLLTVGLVAVFCSDANEAYNVFNLTGRYTKTTFDHLRSYGGHLFIDDGINKCYWLMIYLTWPVLLLYLVSTFFKETPSGYLYKAGHMHWSFLLCAIGGICYHMKWLRNVEEKDITDAIWSSGISTLLWLIGLTIMLTVLANKADDVKSQGFGGDITIMRFMCINIYDFYILHMFISTLVTTDAYLIAAYNFKPVNSNFYVLLVFATFQLYFLFSDLNFTNDRTRYLAGGYITMFVDSFAIMLHQMKTLPSVPLITLSTFVISFLMPVIKIYVQSQNSGKIKQK